MAMWKDADGSVTETSVEGFGQRLMSSVGGMVFGALLFFGSFFVLWWNEGNVVAEKGALNEMKGAVVKADAQAPNKGNEGKLIHAQGKLESKEQLGDKAYLKAGPYLRLEREVEMYQWVEDKTTKSEKNVGGSEKKTTKYTYAKKWASGVEDSSKFKNPEGHINPPLAVKGESFKVSAASFGKMDGSQIVENLTASEKLTVTQAMLAGKAELKDGLIYQRVAPNTKTDSVGDIRISYRYVKAGPYSVMGTQTKGAIVAYAAKNGKQKLLVEQGSKTAEAMVESAKDSAGTFAMIVRVVGFLFMWVGLNLLAGPISTFMDFIPMFGSASRLLLGAVFFVVSAVLSATTIVVGMIAHHPLVLAATILALAGGGFFLYQRKKKKNVVTNPAAPNQPMNRAA